MIKEDCCDKTKKEKRYNIEISVMGLMSSEFSISEREKSVLDRSFEKNGIFTARYGSDKIAAKILCRLGLMYQFSGFSDYKITKTGKMVRDTLYIMIGYTWC